MPLCFVAGPPTAEEADSAQGGKFSMTKDLLRSCTTLSLLLFAGMSVVEAVPNAQAQCSNASLKGAYGFYIGATVLPGGTPRGVLDRIVFDGNGHIVDAVTFNDNGTITHRNDTSVYTVNADCTGTIFPTRGGAIQIMVVNAGNEFYQLRTDPSNIVYLANSAKKQFPGDHDPECSNRSLKGAYGFFRGETAAFVKTPLAAIGRANFDGKGNFTTVVTFNDNGTVTQIKDFGPYTVNADCTGTIGILGGTGTVEIVLVDSHKEFYQLQTVPSAIVFQFSVAKKQSADDDGDQ
jgi:hypothetical protein